MKKEMHNRKGQAAMEKPSLRILNNANKGQAAMEFLMTYGWAILAAIIALGVLASFGVFNTANVVQENAIIGPPFNIRAATINTTTLVAEFSQGQGETLTLMRVRLAGCNDSNEAVNSEPTNLTVLISDTSGYKSVNSLESYYMPSGMVKTLTMDCPGSGLKSGSLFRGDITITYHREGSRLDYESTGTITTKVKAA